MTQISAEALEHRDNAIVELQAAAELGDTVAGRVLRTLNADTSRLGRPLKDDTAALEQVRRLMVTDPRGAVAAVAKALAGTSGDASAIAHRLRYKLRRGL
jgi:hypothetical protein